MKRNIISLILNSLLCILWSIVGIGKAVTEPSWMLLVYGALMAIYLVTTIDDIKYIIRLVKTKKTLTKEPNNEKVIK